MLRVLKCLSNEKRLEIARHLREGEKNVSALESHVGLSQSALSQHLAKMRRAGIVTTRREAQTVFYSLSCTKAVTFLEFFEEVQGI